MPPVLRRSEVWIALGIVALGAFLMIETTQIEVSPSYARVGPRVFPWIVSTALVLLGLGLLREALQGAVWTEEGNEDAVFAPQPFLWMLGGLVIVVATISFVGFPIAAMLLFAAASRGFGSRRVVLDLVVGLALGIVIYIGFHYGLGLTLPAGPIERFL